MISAHTHIGRSFTGHRLEDECHCPQEACGLIAVHRVADECPQHALDAHQTIRQTHDGAACAAGHESEAASYHRISADGTRIECTAPQDAKCHLRPDCDAESWDETACTDHAGEHDLAPSEKCWVIAWTNQADLDDSGPDKGTPGAPVIPVSDGAEWGWDYWPAPTEPAPEPGHVPYDELVYRINTLAEVFDEAAREGEKMRAHFEPLAAKVRALLTPDKEQHDPNLVALAAFGQTTTLD